MKKILSIAITLLLSTWCVAQQQLAFPFQGGNTAMNQFFKDSVTLSRPFMEIKATGVVVFKFTADEKGVITKLVIYYADDAILAPPLIEALKKSNHKWVIPDHEKSHDFIIPFSIGFNAPATKNEAVQKAVYNYFLKRKPIFSLNQVPLDMVTLLPTVLVKYSIEE
ncbi:MAG: hypothetical protein ABI203_08645 [Mucilaginibacter sp.]